MCAADDDDRLGLTADTSDCLARIARHLDVPIDAFFEPEGPATRDAPAPPTAEGRSELLRLYAGLAPGDRTAVLTLVRRLANR